VGDALGSEHARYLKKSGEGVTPDVSVTNFRIVCHRGSCRSGSWEELMGHIADVRQPTSHDDLGSYCTGHHVGTRSEAAQVPRRQHAGSRPPVRSHLGAGSSRDGRENSARLNLND
jgi:hypothetical protein